VADIKEKISKLLALAESPEPEEAKAALLKARALMAKHKLRPEDCQAPKNTKVISELTGVSCTAMTNPWAVTLAGVVAEHYCCRAFRRHAPKQKMNAIGIVGMEEDFPIAKNIFLYAYDCVISGQKHQVSRALYEPAAMYREKCNAYGWGFVQGLAHAFREQEAEHQEWGLVMVVPQAVDDSMKDMKKKGTFGRNQTTSETNECRAMGYQAGREFDPSSRIAAGPDHSALEGVGA